MISASVDLKVQFYHLDPMNIVWHGKYLEFFEQARCELLDKIGYNYVEMHDSGYIWPIVDVHIKYVRPLKFQQEIRVTATFVEVENRMKIRYVITDLETGTKLTKGETIQVAVNTKTEDMCFVSPDVFLKKVPDLL